MKHSRPADIERTSMAIIAEELRQRGIQVPPDQEAVVKRVIHTTADFEYAENLVFTKNAVSLGVAALRKGTPIVTDTNMAKAGISRPGLEKLGSYVMCFMADPAPRQPPWNRRHRCVPGQSWRSGMRPRRCLPLPDRWSEDSFRRC